MTATLSVDLDNLMVRCFGGVDEREYPPGTIDRSLYDLAVHNIRDHFQFIGHQNVWLKHTVRCKKNLLGVPNQI
jgi:hypothetical protein